VILAVLAACAVVGCGIEQLTQGGSSTSGASTASDGGADAADSSLTGAGCGTESTTGAQLCRATSQCPTVAVDPQAFPHCGFRIKGGTSELVCGCGEAMICSMGAFTTCAQAAKLITSQTESSVCAQIAEDRCTQAVPTSIGGSNMKPTCDRSCLVECGSGAGCNEICGC
jgi:hypothetical protein